MCGSFRAGRRDESCLYKGVTIGGKRFGNLAVWWHRGVKDGIKIKKSSCYTGLEQEDLSYVVTTFIPNRGGSYGRQKRCEADHRRVKGDVPCSHHIHKQASN